MGAKNRPLLLGQLSGLVQDLQRNADFADVMQEAQQVQLRKLRVAESDAVAEKLAHPLGAVDMRLGVRIALLQGADEGGQGLGVRGALDEKLLDLQREAGGLDGREDIAAFRQIHHAAAGGRYAEGRLDGGAHAVEHGAVAGFDNLFDIFNEIGFVLSEADGDQMRFIAADEEGIGGHVLLHDLHKVPDPLVADFASEDTVDFSESEDVKHDGGRRMVEVIGIFGGEAAEAVRVQESGEEIDVIGGFRQDEEIAEHGAPIVSEAREIAAKRKPLRALPFDLNALLFLRAEVLREADGLEEFRNQHFPVEIDVAEHPLCLLIVHEQGVFVVKEYDSLPDILENGHGQGFQHIVFPVAEGGPVHQVDAEAVADDRVVDEA